MLDELQLFRGKDFFINQSLSIHHPTLGEICDYGEQRYLSMVANLCATPSDYKVTLWDDMGVDWEKVDEVGLFGSLCLGYGLEETSILFGDFPLCKLQPCADPQTGEPILVAVDGDNVYSIDRDSYVKITDFLRCIHNLEKHVDRCLNMSDKLYLLDRDRSKMRRQKRAKDNAKSMLVSLVSALVNCEQFKYNHSTVWDLPIYAFYDSVRRIQRIKNCDQIVYGVMIDLDKTDRTKLDWMGDL